MLAHLEAQRRHWLDPALERLQHAPFDQLHDDDERQRVGQDAGDVEQLEIDAELEADPVGAAEQLDHQHDLPDQRQARAGGAGEVGIELRQDHVAQPPAARDPEHLGHLEQAGIERAGTLADRDHDVGDLVQRHGQDRSTLDQADPDIGQDDGDQRRQVEEEHQPGLAQLVGEPDPAHQDAQRHAERSSRSRSWPPPA